MPYAKNTIKVKVEHGSGFDKSHRNSGTGFVGTLIPVLCDEVIPKSRVNLKYPVAAQLPPLVSDTYMNCKLKIEAFFVPSRLCSCSFEPFFCDFPERLLYNPTSTTLKFVDSKALLPRFSLGAGDSAINITTDLADYLNCFYRLQPGDVNSQSFLALPWIGYHLIWQEYYRNPRVQNPAFARPFYFGAGSQSASFARCNSAAFLPYHVFHDTIYDGSSNSPANNVIDLSITSGTNRFSTLCADGHDFFECRQRNFGLDYFSGARVTAQQGPAVSLNIPVAGVDEATFSIAQLRAANSLQQFRERNNIPSPRLVDQVKARYGADLSDGVAQRPICIGTASYDINSNGVNQTAPGDDAINPFSGVAAQYGRAYASGSDFIIDDFTANEPGYLYVIQSLVPEVSYSFSNDPMFDRYNGSGSIVDMACSLLQNVGDQPIYSRELTGSRAPSGYGHVFGYTDRFADFMFKKNTVHGKFRDGEDLSPFVLQRSFPLGSATEPNVPELSSDFLEIPKDYLDPVLTVKSSVSGLSYWYDTYIQYRVTMPLAEYSLPSLQDPAYEHGQTVVLHRNGQIF